MTTLHYIYDPLCGWCYAASPLIAAARAHLPVVLHGGGMMAYGHRQHVTPELRNYVIAHDQRIATLTGQPFGEGYFEGLLRDTTVTLDSELPITAVMAAEALAARGLDMLARIQTAHYVEGRRVSEFEVLRALAVEIGLDGAAFEAAYQRHSGILTWHHIEQSRTLLEQVGGRGFPTLLLERDGQYQVVALTAFLGKLPAWQKWLSDAVPASEPTEAPVCRIDGC